MKETKELQIDPADTAGSNDTLWRNKHQLLLRLIEGVDGATNTNEVWHLLQVKGDRSHLYRALLRNFVDNLFLGQRSLLFQDCLNNVSDGTRLKAPFAECIETAANKDELWIADKLVMNSLNGHVLMVEVCLADTVSNIHEVQWLTCLAKDDLDLVADGTRANETPLCQTPTIVDFAESLIDRHTAGNQFAAWDAILEEVQRLNSGDQLFFLHAGAALLQDLHHVFDNQGNVFHGERLQTPERYKRARIGGGIQLSIDREREAKDGTVEVRCIRHALQHLGNQFIFTHNTSVCAENALCQIINVVQLGCANGSAQFGEGDSLNLTDALTCDLKMLSDFLEGLLWMALQSEAATDHRCLFVGQNQKQIVEQGLEINRQFTIGGILLGREGGGGVSHKGGGQERKEHSSFYQNIDRYKSSSIDSPGLFSTVRLYEYHSNRERPAY